MVYFQDFFEGVLFKLIEEHLRLNLLLKGVIVSQNLVFDYSFVIIANILGILAIRKQFAVNFENKAAFVNI